MIITNISLNEFAQKIFQPFLSREEVTEIAINRPGEIWYERCGIWQKEENADINNKLLKSFAISLASFNETSVDDGRPILSGTLEAGERLQVVLPPAVEKNTISVTLRKPSNNILSHTSSKSESRNNNKASVSHGKSESEAKRALMLPQELKQLPFEQEIILLNGENPIKCEKALYYNDSFFMDKLIPLSPILQAYMNKKTLPTKEQLAIALSNGELAVNFKQNECL